MNRKKLLTILIIGIIFYFLGRYLWLHWNKLTQYQWDINIGSLVISYVVLLFYAVLTVYIWKLLIKKLGSDLSFGKSFKIMFLSQMPKYIPGKVWGSLSRIYLCQKEGVSKQVSSASIIYETGLALVAGLIFGLSLLFIYIDKGIISKYIPVFYLIPFILLILHPKIFTKIANFILNKLKAESLIVSFSFWQMLLLVGLYLINWVIMSVALYYFVNSIYTVGISKFPIIVGIFAISVITGQISFFVPAGLGVREGVMTALLSLYLPLEIAIVIAIGSRIWMASGELIAVGAVSGINLIKRYLRKK